MLISISTNIRNFVTRTTYRKEIITVLILKVIGLGLLWYFFFGQPMDHKLTVPQLASRYLSTQ